MTSAPAHHFEVLIVGGGVVGATLGCALGEAGVRAALIEASTLDAAEHPSYDARALALSAGSARVLDALGIWSGLAGHACPIRRIHVSDRGHFGFTRLCAEEHGVPAFGYVAAADAIGRAVNARLGDHAGLEVFCPASVGAVSISDEGVRARVELERGGALELRASLLVAADGGRSRIRALLGIGERRRSYAQVAITLNVTPQRDHRCTAYERFTDSGPLAVLPLPERRCAVVWTVWPEQAEELIALDGAGLTERLCDRFGGRLGAFSAPSEPASYPLSLMRAKETVRPRLAVIGNAAHTLHPIAGQGVNLGLRDVAVLAETVVDSRRSGADPGSWQSLQRYAHLRRADQRKVVRFTDSLVWLFSNGLAPLGLARGLGMTALDLMPGLQRGLVSHAMGLAGRQPRLARGLPL